MKKVDWKLPEVLRMLLQNVKLNTVKNVDKKHAREISRHKAIRFSYI